MLLHQFETHSFRSDNQWLIRHVSAQSFRKLHCLTTDLSQNVKSSLYSPIDETLKIFMTVCLCVFFIYFNQLFQKQHYSSVSVILTLQLYTTFKNLFDGFGAKFWMISSPKFPQYIKGSSGWYTWFLRVMCWEVVLRHFEHSEKSVSLDTNAALGSLCLKW